MEDQTAQDAEPEADRPLRRTFTELPEGQLYAEGERLSEPQTIHLATEGVKWGGEDLTEITLRPMTGKDARTMSSNWNELAALLDIAGTLSGLPDTVLDQLGSDDVGEVLGRVQGLMWSVVELPHLGKDESGALVKVHPPKLAAPFVLPLEGEYTDEKARETVTELRFREVTGAIARSFPAAGLDLKKTPALVEKLTGASARIVDQLTGPDLNRALGVAQCFFGSIRPTGRGSGAF